MTRVPPVPQLGEAAVTRIERDVFAELDGERSEVRRARRWPYALALAAACAAGTFFLVRGTRHPIDVFPNGAQIVTREKPLHVGIEGAMLDVAPDSSVHFSKENDGSVLILDRGRVTCEVAPRSEHAPFVVVAGRTRVIVVGTRFSVERQGDHAAVWVEHGVVQVVDDHADERVGAGESYRPETQPEPAEPPKVASAPKTPPPAKVVVAATPKKAEHVAPAETPAPPAPPAPPVRTISAQQRFEDAARLERSDPEAALRAYAALASGDSTWAANALFASARLESERARVPQARRLLETYLERFPRGINAEDARDMLNHLR